MAELEGIPGTGAEGRVTKKDILNYVANRGKGGAVAGPSVVSQQPAVASQPASAPQVSAPAPQQAAAPAPQGNVEIIEMDRMRKLIADHMVRSVATSRT
jgi:2-oxoglutarate dehydrogenase E2 component (dihydrolipoamide succinyltransferase)